MLSGRVLEIYNKYNDLGCDISPRFPGLDFGPGHIVWADLNYAHKIILSCLGSAYTLDWCMFQQEYEAEYPTCRELFDFWVEEMAFDELGRECLLELLTIPEDELYEGFKSYRPNLEKQHGN